MDDGAGERSLMTEGGQMTWDGRTMGSIPGCRAMRSLENLNGYLIARKVCMPKTVAGLLSIYLGLIDGIIR